MICRMCKGAALRKFLDLGSMPPADQFVTAARLREPIIHYPLEVFSCLDCGLAQLGCVVAPEILYQDDYPYESSTTLSGRAHWAEFAETAVAMLALRSSDLVVDIGCNVGVLLEAFRARGTRILGVDPAANIAEIARQRGVNTLVDFFDVPVAQRIVAANGQAAAITATNVFAHVDDLDAFMRAAGILLRQDGTLIIEAPYFQNLIDNLEYDTIYHEHLSYLSLTPLVSFFRRHGFAVFDVQRRPIHGGSFRVFTSRVGVRPATAIVDEMCHAEAWAGLHSADFLDRFAAQVATNRRDLVWLLQSLKHEGARIAGVSAPAKGMTLLNYCRIGPETLDFVTEKAGLKIGRYTPGTAIPVVPDGELFRTQPDYALLLAWNFAEEIMDNLKSYRQAGGKFILPIPKPRVVD